MFPARLTLSDRRWITDEPLLEITHIKQVRRRKNTFEPQKSENLWKSGTESEILAPPCFFQPLTNTTWFVFHLWLGGRLTNSAGYFFPPPFALAQRRLKICVIVYQEPIIGANAIFVMLYWSQRREFVFQISVTRGSSPLKCQKGLRLITKMRKEREGPARTSYRSTPGCTASVSYRGS